MYRLTRARPTRRLLQEQLPSLSGALLVAELFFKFHSFTLECLAFLLTWYALDGLLALLTGRAAALADSRLGRRAHARQPAYGPDADAS